MDLQLSRKGKQRQEAEDPTESLTKALAKFKEVLTTEQKKQFEDSTTVPDAGGVLFFVAQLDAENASRTRRSVAPRLCTFLTATQQFAGAVETFVSSNPHTAALIWGGIKTAITVASNVASYFDKVTNMIKDIGLVCPTIQQFGQLYHGHIGLQHSLCEYYAVIVELCSKVIEVSRRGLAVQTISSIWSPFESEFKPFLDRLVSSRGHIDLQVSLASKLADQEAKMLLEYESKENSLFRPSALNLLRRSAHQQEEARQWQINKTKREKASLKIKIRQNLSPVDHIQPWKRILKQRVHSTAEWLVHEDAFVEWNARPDTSILWCSGTMGMGKSVLMSNVVSFLHSSRRENDSVAHFFCQTENEQSISARNIVGSICRQLLESLIEESSHETLLSIQNESESLDTNETIQFLLSRLVMERTYYIVLDGLDECEPAQIRAMARALETISQGKFGTLKIICAGRPDLEGDLFKWARPQYRVVLDEGKLTLDMDRYIAATLDDCLEEELLVLRDPEIVTTIVDVLRDGSRGMFFWAGLCIRDLCEKNCDEDILDALNHLPRGLADLFDSKIRRIQQGEDSHQAMGLLRYCGVVKRPLTIDEYREALSVSLGDKVLDTKRLPNNMNRVVRGCFGLTFIDDEEHTVHYIHQSVKEHLFHTEHEETAKFNAKSIDEHFGFLCMTYLNFANFSRQLAKVEKEFVNPLYLGTSSIYPDSSRVNRMARKLLSSRKERSPGIIIREIERTALEPLGDPRHHGPHTTDVMQTGAFLVYAKDNWSLHLNDFGTDDQKMWTLFCKCIEDRSLPLSRPWDLPVQISPGGDDEHPGTENFVNELSVSLERDEQELAWTLKHKHYAFFLYLTRKIRSTSPKEIRSFPSFSDGSSYRWVEMLIDVPAFTNSWGVALFSVALDEGLPEAEKLQVSLALLRKMEKVDANETRFALGMALRRAFFAKKMLKFLLSVDKAFYPKFRVVDNPLDASKADAYFNKISMAQRAPLLIMSLSGTQEWMTTEILRSGADPNVLAHGSHDTALHLAAHRGQTSLIKELGRAGADLNMTSKPGKTALRRAMSQGHSHAVEALVASGADVNLIDVDGKTILHTAAENGLLRITKILVSAAAANVNLKDKEGETPLHKAARAKDPRVDKPGLDVMECLIAAGADVNLANNGGNTALHMAVSTYYQLERLRLLVSAGARVNSKDNDGNTALHKVARVGRRLDTMEYLVSAGADINLTNSQGETAIHIALSSHSDFPKQNVIDYLATVADVANSKGLPSLSNLGERLADLAQVGAWHAVKLLINCGVDVNIRGRHFQKIALHWAGELNQKDIVALLIDKGSDPDTLDTFGQTALHYAAEQGFEEVTASLLKVTDASIVDTKGRTALRCARDNDHTSTVKMLLPFAGPSDNCIDNAGRTLEKWMDLVDGTADDSESV